MAIDVWIYEQNLYKAFSFQENQSMWLGPILDQNFELVSNQTEFSGEIRRVNRGSNTSLGRHQTELLILLE